MSTFSVVDLDLGKSLQTALPLLVIVGAGFGLLYMVRQIQAQNQATQAANAPDEELQQQYQMSELSALLSGANDSATQQPSPSQVTYSAPGSNATTTALGAIINTGTTTNTGTVSGTTNTGTVSGTPAPTGSVNVTGAPATTQLGASTPGTV